MRGEAGVNQPVRPAARACVLARRLAPRHVLRCAAPCCLAPTDVAPPLLPLPLPAQQYLSPEHAKAVSGNNSQGPVYKLYVSGAAPHALPCA